MTVYLNSPSNRTCTTWTYKKPTFDISNTPFILIELQHIFVCYMCFSCSIISLIFLTRKCYFVCAAYKRGTEEGCDNRPDVGKVTILNPSAQLCESSIHHRRSKSRMNKTHNIRSRTKCFVSLL